MSKAKFTSAEIKLCQDIAKYWRKEIKYGDWFICEADEYSRDYMGDGYSFKKGDILLYGEHLPKEYTPLLTLEDCLSFFREKKYPIVIAEDKGEGTCWLPWIDGKDKEFIGKTPLEACLRAVLAVLSAK